MGNELKQVRFVINNGRVLRRINLLRYDYADLETVQKVVEREGLSVNEFLDCINFLSEAGYIHLRTRMGENEVTFAGRDYRELEAKVSATGIRLLAGEITDKLVEV